MGRISSVLCYQFSFMSQSQHRNCVKRNYEIFFLFADKNLSRANDTIDGNGDDDIYETIEFNDSSSSSNLYTEPIRAYGSIRRSVNVKSHQSSKPKLTRKLSKTVKTLKKSSGMMNLQILSQSDDEELLIKDDNVEDVELRDKTPLTNDKCLLPVGR